MMGRPKISDPRCKQLNVSLTVGELESIRQRAKALGMRPVHFTRAILLNEAHKLTLKSGQTDKMEHLIAHQLIRLGNNLNQLVRHLHRTGDPLPPDLEPLLKDIRAIIARRAQQ